MDAVGTAEDPHAVALKVDNGLAEMGLTVCADDEDLRQTLRCILQVLYALQELHKYCLAAPYNRHDTWKAQRASWWVSMLPNVFPRNLGRGSELIHQLVSPRKDGCVWVKAGSEVKEVAHEGLVPFCVEQVFTIPSSSLDHASLGLSEPAESRIVSYLEYSPGRPVIVGVPGPRPAYFIILVSSSRKTSSLLTHHQPVFQVKAHKAPQQPPKIPVISWEGQQPS